MNNKGAYLAYAWMLVTLVISMSYFFFKFEEILNSPGDLGDFLAGAFTFITFPAFFISLNQHFINEKNKKREFGINVASNQLQADLHLFEHLNREFDTYGADIRYQLGNCTGLKPKLNWQKWKDENGNKNPFGYLKISYFDGYSKNKTLDEIRNQKNIQYVCNRFCAHFDIIIEDWERLNKRVRRNPKTIEQIKSHPVCTIRDCLKDI